MPAWIAEVLKLIGLTTPIVYAAATFAFFHMLDRAASPQARYALSNWMSFRPEVIRESVASALVELFDRIYSKPLFSFETQIRSVFFTCVVTFVFLYEGGFLGDLTSAAIRSPSIIFSYLMVNVFSDYAGLFIIRPLLIFGAREPMIALLIGSVLGMALVPICYVLLALVSTFVLGSIVEPQYLLTPRIDSLQALEDWMRDPRTFVYFLAGLVVHIWLPLLATSVAGVKLASGTVAAIKFVQWFLKRGQHHPLDAIGYVAGAIVFIGAATAQILLR